MSKLPQSPEEMPISFHNDGNEIRNCLMELSSFVSVNIHWEMDIAVSNELGERCGEWTVEIYAARKSFRASHSEITNALWYAHALASAADSDEYEQRQKARSDAMAKLTPEDRKALGLA